jgi:hypothetical protein
MSALDPDAELTAAYTLADAPLDVRLISIQCLPLLASGNGQGANPLTRERAVIVINSIQIQFVSERMIDNRCSDTLG